MSAPAQPRQARPRPVMKNARDAIHSLVRPAAGGSPPAVPSRADFVNSLTTAGVEAAKAEEIAAKVFDVAVTAKAADGATVPQPLTPPLFMRRAVRATHDVLRPHPRRERPARPEKH